MENNSKSIELLIERATQYGKTSFELAKLKALDKTSDVVSSVVPHTGVFILFASFMLFLNLGLAFWLGNILGEVYFGFFVIAAFYIVLGLIMHFFVHNWIKETIRNYIINQFLKYNKEQ
jgi:fatty acid desaturase